VAATLADAPRQIILRVAELLQQPAIAVGLFERCQILALDVFDQRQLERLAVADLADDDGDFVQLGQLAARQRRSPATISKLAGWSGAAAPESVGRTPFSRIESASAASASSSKRWRG